MNKWLQELTKSIQDEEQDAEHRSEEKIETLKAVLKDKRDNVLPGLEKLQNYFKTSKKNNEKEAQQC